MPSLAGFKRQTKHLPPPSPQQTLDWMVKLTRQAQFDQPLRGFAEKLVSKVFPHDYLSEYAALLNWTRANIRYVRDPRMVEQVKTARAVYETRTGDCVTLDTKVILRDRAGYYQLRTLSEIRDTYDRYEALSYNFDCNQWTFSPITAWLDKGVKLVQECVLNNGYRFRCTMDHKLFRYQRPGEAKGAWGNNVDRVGVQTLQEILEAPLYPKRLPGVLYAHRIPALGQRYFKQPQESWLAGAYTAEGWTENSHVCIAQTGPQRQEIVDRLNLLGVPNTPSKRIQSGYVSLLKSDFKETLKLFGDRALNKRLPEELLSSSPEELTELLTGYAWGDACLAPKAGPSKVMTHNTISDALAEQLKFMYLVLGRPLSGTLVQEHGGLGKNPIWRLWESSGERYKQVLPDLTAMSIKDTAYVGEEPVCDITVAGTHNFVLANGLLMHNCDCMSMYIGSLAGMLGARVRYVAGAFKRGANGDPVLSHVWCEVYDPSSKAWIILDPVPGRRVGKMINKLVSVKVASAVE